mgnify:CR=1 FL=1
MRGLDAWIDRCTACGSSGCYGTCGGRQPNTISDDTLSPHYGHRVVDLDADGRWHCETCDGPLKPIDGDCYDDVRAAEEEEES